MARLPAQRGAERRLGRGAIREEAETAFLRVTENRVDYDRGDVGEWYVNTPEGLKQGFTLHEPPAGAAQESTPLLVDLALRGLRS